MSGSLTFLSGSLTGTASLASTASSADNFLVRQTMTASGILSTGTITAQTLVVSTVSSSITYSSGSNIFGSQLTNNQTFTGSFYQTGSIANFSNQVCAGGSLVVGTNNAYAIYFKDSTGTPKPVMATAGNTNLNFYNVCSTGQIQFRNAADNAILTSIDNSGSATFNSTNYNVANFNSTYGQSNINIQTNGSTIAVFGSGISVTSTAGACDVGIGTAGLNNNIVFATGTGFTERMRITCTGLIGIGASPLSGTGAALQIEQATTNIVAIRRADCSNTGNSRVLFQAYNASGLIQNTGIVEAGLDNSSTCGYIGFYAGTATMNMKITAAGNVGINTTNFGERLNIGCGGAIAFQNTCNCQKWHIQYNSADGLNFVESTVADYRLFLKAGGNVGINTNSADFPLTIKTDASANSLKILGRSSGDSSISWNSSDNVTQYAHIDVGSSYFQIYASNSQPIQLYTGGTERLRLNNVGGFGTQLCNFCLSGTYQTLVTVENGSYGLLMLSSCLGGGTYALYNVFNNAGTTTANLIHGNNIPVQISGNAVQVRSSNSAGYCDMRSSYIRFY